MNSNLIQKSELITFEISRSNLILQKLNKKINQKERKRSEPIE